MMDIPHDARGRVGSPSRCADAGSASPATHPQHPNVVKYLLRLSRPQGPRATGVYTSTRLEGDDPCGSTSAAGKDGRQGNRSWPLLESLHPLSPRRRSASPSPSSLDFLAHRVPYHHITYFHLGKVQIHVARLLCEKKF